MKILVTGGAGYIGSHTCVELLRASHEVCVVDNLVSGNIAALERIRRLVNTNIDFKLADIRNSKILCQIFAEIRPDAVIHFAGLKSVSESISDPSIYYDVNVGGTASLLTVMNNFNCKKIVFSSSATVYGVPDYLPCDELHALNPINPYGRTKLVCENLLRDWADADISRRCIALRYFNPVGAHESGLIGEDHRGSPSNLMPIISKVALRQQDYLEVYGNDYDTFDGSGIRDYIHVVDLASAHSLAIEKIQNFDPFEEINIGTGTGISVFQLVEEFEKQSGKKIKLKITNRRFGDASEVWADPSKASRKLGFKAIRGRKEMCEDTWNWISKNPFGYKSCLL